MTPQQEATVGFIRSFLIKLVCALLLSELRS